MIGIIPIEFVGQASDSWHLEVDVMVEEAKRATLVRGEPKEVRFKKWTKIRHFKPLYIKAHRNGKDVSKVLID